MPRMLGSTAAQRGSCCQDCPDRVAGCHGACEKAAVEDIVKIIERGDRMRQLQVSIDLCSRKQVNITRRKRKEKQRNR